VISHLTPERVSDLRDAVADHRRLGWAILATTTETVAALLDAAEENARLRADRDELRGLVDDIASYVQPYDAEDSAVQELPPLTDAVRDLAADRDALVAEIKAHHNGYGETGKALGWPEPESPLVALRELLTEQKELQDDIPASQDAGSSWRPRVWPSSRRASAAQVTATGCAPFVEVVVLGAFVAAAIAVAAGVWPWVAR